MSEFFKVVNLRARIEEREILKGLNLEVNRGEIHAIMGPNGSGKTTLSSVIMGSPTHEVEGGDILFKGESILELPPDERAKRGIFLAFQHPEEIPGVSFINFLRIAYNAVFSSRLGDKFVPPKPMEFRNLVKSKIDLLGMDDYFLTRYLNEGFSGGEKKRAEMVQMLLLEPELVIMDETDSGLDIDALKLVANAVMNYRSSNNSFVVITHYSRVLKYIKPDFVHVMFDGRIVKTGDYSLSEMIEEKGYDWVVKQATTNA
ncbi:MAG: Fe-S cluster assembly ATPase SufC [Spirochaetia bacterium]|nr:Fe-S cluster assembly ATPase SufC [Spirochaetota bacterium]MCX8097369.1 Fe-S cluster assembly ATPase SufC [Spirochaetota bacterium]MDW8112270.1 Fe-S cluster assembly ATPase SufC [Spirochaetia bacterium]